ncbi:MAG: hypothetical protein KGH89_06845 [Thaumarchaeota archaeon]|nr:hypothetical protein [Nitrososphaerota archaeon]MDE1867493.1 hypothetical protein [Nitrososphaerota archaeon]
MDKRILLLGIAMLAAGGLSWFYFNSVIPMSTPNMTEEETNAFYQAQAVNIGLTNISEMVAGLGFFITLISFGLRRRKKGGVGKPVTQKPAEV